ncbi:MAG: transcriptional regulator GcvA [Rhodocyclaceae bacterium]|nr:transcriptional regulator GcvA [Rhodocyclaceae bacterium]
MTYRLPPLVALRAFDSAARHLSFKKAADELHVTPAAISQQIKALESYLDVVLFRRLTRALEVTPQGLAMLPKVREGFECLAAAVATTRQSSDGALTVTAPPSFASRWLVPRLSRFAAAYPGVELRLASSADSVDQRGETAVFEEGMVDPREAASEVAIRYGSGNYPGFRVDKIFAPERVPVCSPRLPTAERPLAAPGDLCRHVLIHDETIDDEDRQTDWAQWLGIAGVDAGARDAQRGPRFSNAVLAVEAALDGQGVALALKPLVEADVAAGRLIIPFDIAVPSAYAYFLVMPQAVGQRPSVAAFRAWLLAEGQRVSGRQAP